MDATAKRHRTGIERPGDNGSEVKRNAWGVAILTMKEAVEIESFEPQRLESRLALLISQQSKKRQRKLRTHHWCCTGVAIRGGY